MLDALIPSPPDKILALIAAYNADPRTDKLDLGVGVYRDSTGHTAIMNAVKTAEARLLEAQDTKTYLGLAGDVGFNDAMTRLVLGPVLDTGRTAALQTPGGSGALRLLAELVRRAKDDAVVWLSDPTWPNHAPILDQVGLKQRSYPYFDRETRAV
ncbi:MAG: aminotransferase class I/II-fold pyridoxal phosphate-dependent enzyme, partial [Rhodobacterales bacterium]|nr:aminotransferase class I/II-fold pyridoxal phosphate-dependent enzyme [Rhodobacterales bacterium]